MPDLSPKEQKNKVDIPIPYLSPPKKRIEVPEVRGDKDGMNSDSGVIFYRTDYEQMNSNN